MRAWRRGRCVRGGPRTSARGQTRILPVPHARAAPGEKTNDAGDDGCGWDPVECRQATRTPGAAQGRRAHCACAASPSAPRPRPAHLPSPPAQAGRRRVNLRDVYENRGGSRTRNTHSRSASTPAASTTVAIAATVKRRACPNQRDTSTPAVPASFEFAMRLPTASWWQVHEPVCGSATPRESSGQPEKMHAHASGGRCAEGNILESRKRQARGRGCAEPRADRATPAAAVERIAMFCSPFYAGAQKGAKGWPAAPASGDCSRRATPVFTRAGRRPGRRPPRADRSARQTVTNLSGAADGVKPRLGRYERPVGLDSPSTGDTRTGSGNAALSGMRRVPGSRRAPRGGTSKQRGSGHRCSRLLAHVAVGTPLATGDTCPLARGAALETAYAWRSPTARLALQEHMKTTWRGDDATGTHIGARCAEC
jgi:hypothetical protein